MRVERGKALGILLSNTWLICPWVRDTPGKLGLIPPSGYNLEWYILERFIAQG